MAIYNLLPLLEKKTDKQQILTNSVFAHLQNEAAKNTFQKLKIWIYVGILTQLCLGISLAYHSWKQTNSETLAVYHIYQQTAILWRKGNEGVLLTSSNFTKNSFDFNLKNHIVSLGNPHLDSCKIGNETVSKRLWTWKPPILSTPFGRIAIITPDFTYNRSAKPLKVRAVVLSNKPKISLPELQTLFDTPHIIADGTNSQYRIQKWEKTAPSTTLLYKTSLSGTFLSIN
jgi:hypothetical protein